MKLSKLIASAFLLCSSLSLSATPIVVTDSNQLDFEGNFIYAINFFGFAYGDVSIGDADFVNVLANGTFSPSGFSISGFNRNADWSGGSNIGSGTDNDSLESIFRSIVWSGEVVSGAMSLDVVSGANYKVQLLFSECCSDRSFAASSEDGSFSEQYQQGTVWQGSSTQGYLSTWNFMATDSELNIDFQRLQGGDTNYHISGLTVERLSDPVSDLPAPGTLALLGLSLMGLVASGRLKR